MATVKKTVEPEVKVTEPEPQVEVTPEPEVKKDEAKAKQTVVAIYFAGHNDALIIPTLSSLTATDVMTSLDEQRGRAVELTDNDGAYVRLFPAQIAFMRVETR